MPILLLVAAAIGGFFLVKSKSAGASSPETPASPDTTFDFMTSMTPVAAAASNVMGLPDVLPSNQKGLYRADLDDAFERVSAEKQVPFALLKAHALRESNLDASAYRDEGGGRASFGALQILWWAGSNRFASYGYDDDAIGDGSILYDPYVNASISAEIMKNNWSRFGNVRDMINAYNTGKSESVHEAPNNYVDDVLNYYGTITGQTIA